MDDRLNRSLRRSLLSTERWWFLRVGLALVGAGMILLIVALKYGGSLLSKSMPHLILFLVAAALLVLAAAMFFAIQKQLPSLPKEAFIAPAPGFRLRRLAQLWFSKKVYTFVFEPVLSDLQHEYVEALAEHDRWKSHFALARGYWAFWLAVVAQLPVSLLRVVVELWKATRIG
jgi:hypothetical protein